jgi:hypothetical protein
MFSNFNFNNPLKFGTPADAAVSGGWVGAGIATMTSLAFFIALDRWMAAQNDPSNGAARGIFSFIAGPIITYYAFEYGRTTGMLIGGAGRLVYDGIRMFQSHLASELTQTVANLAHRHSNNR